MIVCNLITQLSLIYHPKENKKRNQIKIDTSITLKVKEI